MKQKVVAERAGFTPQEFSNILNERRKLLRVEYMPAIADAMEVDVNELYGINRKEWEIWKRKTKKEHGLRQR